MSECESDVIVVGAGPAGAATAARLATLGHRVMLMDRARFPREKACAEFLSPGTVRELAVLGVLPEVVKSNPAWLPAMTIQSPAGRYLLDYANAPASSLALGIRRSVLDTILVELAARRGAEVLERVRVREVLRQDGQIVGVRARKDGRDLDLRARFVIGADGCHSAVSRTLGLDVIPRWPRRLGLVARYEGVPLTDGAEMHVGPPGYCGLAPVGGGQVNVGLVVPAAARPVSMPVSAFFDRAVDAIPGVAALLHSARRATPIRGVGPLARRVRAVSGRGFLLVGDAAGFLDPFTGEGVYRALAGGRLAANAVSSALAMSSATPVGYVAARHAAFRDKERLCLVIQLLLTAPPVLNYAVRRLGRRPRAAETLTGVLGDLVPAGPALSLPFLWSMLRP